MPKTFDDLLSEVLSERLDDLDKLRELWNQEVKLRDQLDNLLVVRMYAHLEGGVKEAVNLYLQHHRTQQVSKLKTCYWFWRERSRIDDAARHVISWDSRAIANAVLDQLRQRRIKPIDVRHEYNQMYSNRVAEILLGIGLNPAMALKNALLLDDLVRKRHLVAHGNGVLPKMSQSQLNGYRAAVDDVLIDLWDQLVRAHPDGMRR